MKEKHNLFVHALKDKGFKRTKNKIKDFFKEYKEIKC